MITKNEFIEKKKQLLKEVLDYSYITGFIMTINNFDHRNKRHLILILRNFRDKNAMKNDEEKRILNHMIANENNIEIVKDSTLEELIEEAYKRKEIAKNYIVKVVEKLKNDK